MIRVTNLSKYYGNTKAINNISFNINKGEVVGLLGPNAAGKTTTMKILTCFMYPTNGDVLIDGIDIWGNTEKIREKIGYLPENNPLYFEMSVFSYLSFIAKLRKISRKSRKNNIDDVIEMTGLNKMVTKKIGLLSKGYRQRVGIAQSLIHNPEILILDEPTSGLDPNQIVEIRKLLKNVGQSKTVIISTHILNEVEQSCSRAIILDKGKIVTDSSIKKLKYGKNDSLNLLVKGNITKDLINKLFLDKAKIDSFDQIDSKIFKISLKSENDIREFTYQSSIKNNFVILEMYNSKNSLESIFTKLTMKDRFK